MESLLAPVESFHDEMDEDDFMARYSNRTRTPRPSRGNKQKRRQSSSSSIVMPNRQASLSKEKGLYVHTRRKYAVIAAVVGACIVAASVAGVLISSSDNKKEKEEDLHTTRTSIFSPDADPNTDEFWGDAKGARMIVKYDTDAALQLANHCAHKVVTVKQDHNGEEGKFMAFYGDASCKAKLEEAQESKDIEVIYDYPTEAFSLNEPRTTIISHERLLSDEITPWGMRQIGLEGVTYGNATEVTVCVVDSGIKIDHPEFTDSVSSINGVDVQRFWGEPWKWNEDHDGHGTFVAG